MAKTKAHTKYETADGTPVPGVTTVIGSSLGWNKNVLIAWARREALSGQDPSKVLAKAADIGTIVHYLIECHIKGKEADLGDYAANDIDKAETGFLGFLDWEKANEPEYKLIEKKLVSESLKVGGTLDMTCIIRGKKCIYDFKTSKGIYPDHKIQLAAYSKILQEMYPQVLVDEHHVIQVSKEDGGVTDHNIPATQIELGWEVFQHCVELYHLKKKMGG